MEQAIMLAVFALAAALCLRAFVWADLQSRQMALRDAALLRLQSAAEVLKDRRGSIDGAVAAYGGTRDGDDWVIWYDEDWNQSASGGAYCLRAVPEAAETAYLGAADIEVTQGADGLVLSSLRVCWQEVTPHG
jgi:hypothetical protein